MTTLAPLPAAAITEGRPAPASDVEAIAFGWLSTLFARPIDTEGVAAHREGPVAALIADLAVDPELAGPVADLRAALDGEVRATAIRLAIAHRRLFDGLAGPETVPPYESAHVGDGRLFGAPVAEMERLIAAHDLRVADDAHEPADHVAIELALMARLVALDHPDREALAVRLAGWIPAFARACEVRDRCGFHAAAARLLAILVEREVRSRTFDRDDPTKGKRRTR